MPTTFVQARESDLIFLLELLAELESGLLDGLVKVVVVILVRPLLLHIGMLCVLVFMRYISKEIPLNVYK